MYECLANVHHTTALSRFKLKRHREYGCEDDDEGENTSEATITNKENEPIIDPKNAKRKAQRDVMFQQILSSSNPNNRTTYPSANYKRIFVNSLKRR